MSQTITELERKVILGIMASEYCDGDPMSEIWSWSIRAPGIAKKSLSGIVSSLSKKGLVICRSGEIHSEDTIAITQEAFDLVQ
jgi:hypothetical protein